MPSSEKTKKLLNDYLRKLTNLSGGSRSIFFPRLTADQTIDVHEFSQLNKEKSFTILEALIAGKKKSLCAVVDSRLEANNDVSTKLKRLNRIDHFVLEERGTHDLHIGWPFVRGKFSDGTLVRCPLLFFPVELTVHNNQWVLSLREGAELSFNKSFLLAYSFYNKVKADESLLEETFDEADKDSTVFRTQLYQLLQKSNVDINFNPDNYQDELIHFANFTRPKFDEGHKNGELKLFPEAVLGIFPQAGSTLVPDYLHLLSENSFNDLEEFFHRTETPPGTNFLQQIKEERVYSIFPSDIWQENALKASKVGRSIVVQGPPGTGKSQLICNLISDYIAYGKRVLVVCQKRAALDVVYSRMRDHRLDDFIAVVHDFKNDRREIYQKIATQIDRIEEYKTRNISSDAIQLDRKFHQAGKVIDLITDELEEFRKALYDESECGVSVKELYLRSNPNEPCINLKQEYQYYKFDHLDSFLRRLRQYMRYAVRFKAEGYVLGERKSFAGFSITDLNNLKAYIKEIQSIFGKITVSLVRNFNSSLDWEQCEFLLEKEYEVLELKNLLANPDTYHYFQSMMQEEDDETSSLWLANMERVMLDCFKDEGIEQSTAAVLLGSLQESLHRSMETRRGFIGLLRWELFSKDKYIVNRALVSNGLQKNKEGFEMLERRLDNRLNFEHQLSKLKGKPWLKDIPKGFIKNKFITWFADQQNALRAKLLFRSIRGIRNVIEPTALIYKDFVHQLDTLYYVLAEIPPLKTKWLQHLTVNQVTAITKDTSYCTEIMATLSQDFDALCEFDKLEESMDTHDRSVIDKLYEEQKAWDDKKMSQLFINSLCIAWIDYIETKHPELRIVSSGKIEALENDLKEKIAEKQNICEEIILLRSREQIIDNLEFNRLHNRVTYRDLHHQVTKKKKVWPVRKLVTEFESEVFKLLPCWLASPESVSAIFPMKEVFDLVIFDEASQCFAERGIPSLYRAKQAVIAGDSQQLRPGDFYHARWQDDDMDDPDSEVDSLLDLADRYLYSVSLQGHYRSHSLELIDFSNRFFYKGKLQLLPDLKAFSQTEPVIDYIKVEGEWVNNTNETEALRIADIVFDLSQKSPSKEIGIITFNAPQQMLIMDVLEERFQGAKLPLPEKIFVKNIENVQGDERDIVIFSVGYAANKKGKVSAQFGSLNIAGGENRLNVAVSRAREKIILVTSVWPEELEVEETKNAGPKLLKGYLSYALEVSRGNFKPFAAMDKKHEASWYLKNLVKATTEQKWQEHTLVDDNLPFSDLVVQKSKERIGALLTDDENYYQSLSAKASHALTPQLLEYKNWPFLRIYSRNYWQDRDRFFNEVGKFIFKT